MRKLFAIAAALVASIAVPASATLLYGVDEQNRLISFDSAAVGTTLTQVSISGTSATMLALDFRTATGGLYGLGDDLKLYTINTATGLASAVSAAPLALAGTNFGFDFNPSVDLIRVVSNSGGNYVVNPNTGALQTVATPVAYAAGDPNFGAAPTVTANAYMPVSLGTQLYAIDSGLDVLTRQANSAGTLNTVGAIGLNFGPRDSFDIDNAGLGFAQDGNSIYRVNFTTGQFTLLGNTDRVLYGIAAIPEPGTWAMMIGGFGLIGGTLRTARRERKLQAA